MELREQECEERRPDHNEDLDKGCQCYSSLRSREWIPEGGNCISLVLRWDICIITLQMWEPTIWHFFSSSAGAVIDEI